MMWRSAKPGLEKDSLPFFQGGMQMILYSFVCTATGTSRGPPPEGLLQPITAVEFNFYISP